MKILKNLKTNGCGLMRSASFEVCVVNGSVQLRAGNAEFERALRARSHAHTHTQRLGIKYYHVLPHITTNQPTF
jgi:hypothetical protein